MRVLITGVNGFAASHLVKLLYEKGGFEIHGTKRVRSDMYRLEKMNMHRAVEYHLIELTDAASVYNVIKEVMPDQIYHLAAQDYVKSSWDSPHETFRTNVEGTINLFMAIRQCYQPKVEYYETTGGTSAREYLDYPKVLVTSTSESYGYHKKRINEETEQKPINPYGISKQVQDSLARLYNQAYDIPVVITRSFNVTGWGRNDPFVDSDFAKQVAEIEKGNKEPVIRHGNLEARRTFFDVKDAVRGYYLAMNSEYDKGDVFCFGKDYSTSIQEMLDFYIHRAKVDIKAEVDQKRFRPVDTPDMLGDFSKAKELLGWKSEIDLTESLNDLLYYWRERL